MSEYTRKPRSTRHNKKHMPRVLLVVCLMLVVMVGSIAGTVAWLTDKTNEVTNTFTTAGIEIDLYETLNPDGTEAADGKPVTDWSAQLIPGKVYGKNPKVVVDASKTDVDIYLFVKFEEPTAAANPLEYDCVLDNTGSGWTKLTGVDGVNNVWYRTVDASQGFEQNLLVDNKVTVKSTLTKDNMPKTASTMKFTAYAIQKSGNNGTEFTPAQAWVQISK